MSSPKRIFTASEGYTSKELTRLASDNLIIKLIQRKPETMETLLNCQNRKSTTDYPWTVFKRKMDLFEKGNKCIIVFYEFEYFYHKNRTLEAEIDFKIACSPTNSLQAKRYWPDLFLNWWGISAEGSKLFMCHRFKPRLQQKKSPKGLSCFIFGIIKHIARAHRRIFFPLSGGR